MTTVPSLKRGHHSDFALSREEIQLLIDSCTDRRTKAMVLLASLGVPRRWITEYNAKDHLYKSAEGVHFLSFPGMEDITVNPKEYQFLALFPIGFDVTDVTVWRRVRRAIIAAGREGIIKYDPERIPFLAALGHTPTQETLPLTQMMRWCLERIHALQSRLPNQEFGSPDHCPHKDCERIREWVRLSA